MKRFAKGFLCAILAIALFTVPSFAHSGRTDEFGGHYDRSTGEYHYHHGYPAHQHENGVCPYDFDDQTNHGNSGTSGSSTSRKSVTTVKQEEKPKTDPITKVCIVTAVVVVLGSIITFLILRHHKQVKEENQEKERLRVEREKRKNELLDIYRGKTPTDIAIQCGLDRAYNINGDGDIVPIDGNNTPDVYTVYVTRYGKSFHIRKGCSTADIEVNWGSSSGLHYMEPCRRCRAEYPPLDWLPSYRKIMRELAEYNISLDDLLPKEQEGEDDA